MVIAQKQDKGLSWDFTFTFSNFADTFIQSDLLLGNT